MQPAAVTPAPPKQPQPAALAVFDARVSTHRLERRLVTAGRRTFQIFLAIPCAQPPEHGYPLLYMLDGNAAFDALTPAHLEAAPGLALAGVGYETDLRFDVIARSFDYTPAETPLSPGGRKTGGADAFLHLLTGELRRKIETALPVDPSRRTLWGHSLAGMCALHALLTRPGAFSRHISVSPSIWWNDQWMLGLESATPPTEHAARVLLMLGDAERRSNPAGPHWEGPAPHTLEMADRLRRRPQLAVDLHIFEGLGHAATLPASLEAALALASAPENG
ncbi:alpha/beta hydrolase [Aquamicrobium ahrensii]|uniref:Alpha/beta superfamily hydrolase n=1 Tax=Aquamicrobium ahrensii TaxID=469551 RepID=A0ABV2KII6_9HYPH